MNPVYNVSESSASLEVCVELATGQADIDVEVMLTSQSGNAEGIFEVYLNLLS